MKFSKSWYDKQCFHGHNTECVTDLDYQSEIIIFGSILTTFELSSIFGGS